MKWLLRIFNWGIAAIVLFIVLSNFWIISSSKGKIFDSIEKLPQIDTAIVFGTSKYRVGGGANPFFENRMKAASELYHSGKVKILILSGSRDKQYYNEPDDMQKALIELGVKPQALLLDTLGLRSFDTIIRGKYFFGVNAAILVTQEYHAHRTLFISKQIGMYALCYEAKFPNTNYSVKMIIREILARPKAVLDSYFLH